MRYLVLFLFFLGSEACLNGQQDNCACQSGEDYAISLKDGLIGREYRNPLKGYTGNQFYCEWTRGEVNFKNGDVIKGIDLRYEIYLDELLWLRNSDYKAGILYKPEIEGFSLYDPVKNQTVRFISRRTFLPVDEDSVNRYLQVLETGKLSLYAFRYVTRSTNDFMLSNNTRYLLWSGDQVAIIRLRKSDLLKAGVVDKARMKAILRANRIDVYDNEAEMTWVVSLYNRQ